MNRFLKLINQTEITDFTKELIVINTVNPPGNEFLCEKLITTKFREIGLKVKTHSFGPNRMNFVGEIGEGKPSVALIGHLDTVPSGSGWKTDPFEGIVRQGKLYGRGASDNKGPLVAAWAAVKAFLASGIKYNGKIYLVAAADEETGSEYGIRALIKKGFKPNYALVPDAGSFNEGVIGEKGIFRFTIESFGKEAHGASPYRGINAILPLAFFALQIEKIKFIQATPYFKPLTVNVGQIEGGTASNVVPAYAKLTIDIRYPPPITIENVQEKVRKIEKITQSEYPDIRLKTTMRHTSRPHLLKQEGNVLLQSFNQAASELGISMSYKTTGGNTVAKFLAETGVEAFCHSPSRVSIEHMVNEYIRIKDLVSAAGLYATTIKNLFAGIEYNKKSVSKI